MPIYETFSERMHRMERDGQPVTFQFDKLPDPLRVKARFIIDDALGSLNYGSAYYWIKETAERANGILDLGKVGLDAAERMMLSNVPSGPQAACLQFILRGDRLAVLDVIELALLQVDSKEYRKLSKSRREDAGIRLAPDEAIIDMNAAFRRHDVGYQYSGGKMVRVDSLYMHREVVEPAIVLMHAEGFEGALDEFMKAHEHFQARSGQRRACRREQRR